MQAKQPIRFVAISPSWTKSNPDEILVPANQIKDFMRRHKGWRIRLIQYAGGAGDHTWRWTKEAVQEVLAPLPDNPWIDTQLTSP